MIMSNENDILEDILDNYHNFAIIQRFDDFVADEIIFRLADHIQQFIPVADVGYCTIPLTTLLAGANDRFDTADTFKQVNRLKRGLMSIMTNVSGRMFSMTSTMDVRDANIRYDTLVIKWKNINKSNKDDIRKSMQSAMDKLVTPMVELLGKEIADRLNKSEEVKGNRFTIPGKWNDINELFYTKFKREMSYADVTRALKYVDQWCNVIGTIHPNNTTLSYRVTDIRLNSKMDFEISTDIPV